MSWIKDLLGITADIDEWREFFQNRINLIHKEMETMREVNRARKLEVDKQFLSLESKVGDLPQYFREGIVKLDKNEVYVIHVAEGTKPRDIENLRSSMQELDINAVIIASESINVIKI
jgi:hypothetical protein